MRIAAVDLISNTCFPALAAHELGYFKAEGLDVEIELVSSIGSTKALRAGEADAMIAGSVFDALTEFPDWKGAKVCVALSQGTPWLLTIRSDLALERGDILALRGLTLTAAEGPDLAFKYMLQGGGLDPEKDIKIIDLPGSKERDVSFGVFAANALNDGIIDGYWSNAMGAETAVSRGIGKIHVDVRRGDDPGDVRFATCAGLVSTDDYISREPEAIDAAVRAIVKTQSALRADASLSREVGDRLFPPEAASLITSIVERDALFYDPGLTRETVKLMNNFAYLAGQLSGPIPYEQVIAARCTSLWADK
jgi:NitT/TauT family transport system substrate-binding protein